MAPQRGGARRLDLPTKAHDNPMLPRKHTVTTVHRLAAEDILVTVRVSHWECISRYRPLLPENNILAFSKVPPREEVSKTLFVSVQGILKTTVFTQSDLYELRIVVGSGDKKFGSLQKKAKIISELRNKMGRVGRCMGGFVLRQGTSVYITRKHPEYYLSASYGITEAPRLKALFARNRSSVSALHSPVSTTWKLQVWSC